VKVQQFKIEKKMNADTTTYNEKMSDTDREICDILARETRSTAASPKPKTRYGTRIRFGFSTETR